MKKLGLVISVFIVFATSVGLAKTRIAVSTFGSKIGDSRCTLRWFSRTDIGEGFRDQIVTALMEDGKYEVMERENLKRMHNEEHDLINSDKSAAPAKNKFKAAHFSITGAVTSFELCSEGVGGDVDVGGLLGFKGSGLKMGAKNEKAKVILDLRVVEVETGRVAASFQAEGTASSTKVTAKGDVKGAGFGSDVFFATPIGEASREAIKEAVSKIASAVPTDKVDQMVADSGSQDARPTTAINGARPGPRAMDNGAQEYQNTSSYYCASSENYVVIGQRQYVRGTTFEACKPMGASATGKNMSVMYLNNADEKIVKMDQIKKATALTAIPRVGQPVFVSGKDKRMGQCKVVDTVGNNAMLNCGQGLEYTMPISKLFTMESYKANPRQPSAAGN
jgi:curli biogenesis system outer membrane secretion channel CsgG